MFSPFKKNDASSDRLSASEFADRVTKDDVVIDVRTDAEFEQAHLEGARQVNLQAPDFQQQIDALDRDQTYYLYCRSGGRSGKAVGMMRQMGFADVHNVGGLKDLAEEGLDISR